MTISPIASLLKEVMAVCGLKQKDLGEVLCVPLDRVKSLTSGKVKKLDPDETRRLVQTLNLNAHWLATGTGEMFNAVGGERMSNMLIQLKHSSSQVEQMGLEDDDAIAARDIAMGVGAGNQDVVISAIQRLRKELPADEQMLLDTYRRCTREAKANLIQTAALLSAGMAAPVAPPATPSVGDNHQVNSATGAVQVIGSGNKVLSRTRK